MSNIEKETNYDPSAYKPQGDGPHATLAANMMDPNIKADGHMNQGQGVGGMSEGRVREEGLEHIKKNSGYDQSTADTSSTTGTSEGQQSGGMLGSVKSMLGLGGSSTSETQQTSETPAYSSTETPAYSSGETPAYSSTTGETPAYSTGSYSTGQGPAYGTSEMPAYAEPTGTSREANLAGLGTTYTGVPQSDLTQPAAGYGTSGTSSTYGTSGKQFTEDGVALGDSTMGAGSGSALGAGSGAALGAGSGAALGDASNAERGDAPDYTGSRAPDHDPATSVQQPHDITEGGPAVSGDAAAADAAGTKDPEKNTAAMSETPVDKNVSEDPSTQGGEGEGEKSESKPKSNKGGLEHPEAIPTAGGERLGKQHWGESKIVPDNPKTQEEKVSSKEGQPTDEVRDNTNRNTGGASDAQGGEHKESMMDKIKHKAHMG